MTGESIEKDKSGATVVPILMSTDKTQLTLFRNKSTYLIYMMIGKKYSGQFSEGGSRVLPKRCIYFTGVREMGHMSVRYFESDKVDIWL